MSRMEVSGGATQQGVELVELAALALPAHPYALGCVPTAFAVEEQEAGPAPGGLAVRALSRSMDAVAAASRASSPGTRSCAASSQSVSRAKRRSPSAFAR